MRRKTIIILALILVFALMFTACAVRTPLQTPARTGQNTTTGTGTYTGKGTTANNPYDVGYYGYNNNMYGGYGTNYRNIGGTNYSPNLGMGNTGIATTEADKLAGTCRTVPGITNATVVISGNTAYVGVNTNRTPTGSNISYGTANDMSAIKRQCSQKIKAADPKIKTVYVSTDANFFDRLRKVGEGVKSGSPISSFKNELSTLVRGLTPERQ